MPALHHIELWVQDFSASARSLGWLFERLGLTAKETWGVEPIGRSWQGEGFYIVLEAGPAVTGHHDRLRAGLNHLAFSVISPDEVNAIAEESVQHGWKLMFPQQHPFAGGPEHYAAYLEDDQGFEVEIVAAMATEQKSSS